MKNKKQKEINKAKKKKDGNYWLPIGMCLGISIGTAVGAATNNMGLWLPIGLCIGVSLGVVFSNENDEDDDKK